MGDFVSSYSENSHYPPQPATTSTSAFRSAGESSQAGTSYANTQIDSQHSKSFINLEKLQQQPSSATYARNNQAMSAYDMQEGQNRNNNNNNNMSYDPSFSNFDPSLTGYQNDYSDMSYNTANQQQQQHAQQQQHFYDRQQQQGSGFQREVSDNFGTVSAGPPSPGKMDMLPHGHTNYTSSSGSNPPNSTTTTTSQHQRNRTTGSIGGGEYDAPSQASHLARAPTTKGSSTTSEFTKRKNWSQRIVEEMQDVLHVLSPSGIFLFISPSIYEITGYTPEELVGRGITDFIDRDDIDNFTRDFSESIQTNQALTTYIRFRKKDEQGVLFEVTGQPYYSTASSSQKMARTSSSSSNTNDSPIDTTMSSSRKPAPSSSSSSETVCKCFFAMARLYPGKNNAMLDSFLELKMENEKLRERLAEIYQEIEGDSIEANMGGGGGGIIMDNVSTSTMGTEANNEPRQISGYPSRLLGANQQQQQQPQPIQPSPSNPYAMSTETEVPKSASSASFPSTFYNYPSSSAANPYSQQNLQQIQPNNNNNQYNNADASTSQRGNTISQDQLLVSSAGLIPSSGNTYGALGIGISPNLHRNNNNASGSMSSNQYTSNNSTQKGGTATHHSNADYGDTSMRDDGNVGDSANKKKKQKKQRVDEGEFVCRDCGTVDSPEWRRGPQGPKTLCNACGLRWAKKNKQSRNSIGGMEGIA